MKIKTEYKVGLIGLITILVLYFGIMFLKGKDIFNVETSYYTVFDDVSGLYKSNYIYLNGMKVGYIKDITMLDQNAKKFLVWIAVTSDVKIPVDSKIAIFASDILGSKALKINMGMSKNNFNKRDTIPSGIENGMLDQLANNLAPIAVKLNNVMTTFDSILIGVNNVMDRKTQENIMLTMESIKNTAQSVENISLNLDKIIESEQAKIKTILANAESITSNLKENNVALTNAINNFSNISDTIAKANLGTTITETNLSLKTLSNVLKAIENGEGNAGLLIKDDKLYKNLESSTKSLDLLIEDIKANPRKYIKLSIF
ncbi:MAG: MlaD family protein [Bacteroidales bacterium]|nr:MlaD family protein [Bacteroidales bacterium]MDD4684345.1 MlaD family protein [Bacteroidales bacterium]